MELTRVFQKLDLNPGASCGSNVDVLVSDVYAPRPRPYAENPSGLFDKWKFLDSFKEKDEEFKQRHLVKRKRYNISFLTVCGIIICVALLVLCLLMTITLTQTTDSASLYEEKFLSLKEENDSLKAQYEIVFDLNTVETYAILELGMQKPVSSQYYFVDASLTEDRVVILEDENSNFIADSVLFLKELFSSCFGEYMPGFIND